MISAVRCDIVPCSDNAWTFLWINNTIWACLRLSDCTRPSSGLSFLLVSHRRDLDVLCIVAVWPSDQVGLSTSCLRLEHCLNLSSQRDERLWNRCYVRQLRITQWMRELRQWLFQIVSCVFTGRRHWYSRRRWLCAQVEIEKKSTFRVQHRLGTWEVPDDLCFWRSNTSVW